MKKVLIVLATTMFFTSMNFLNATTISGKIIAKHISEKIIAHLLITNLIDSISTHIVEVKSDGSFTFELSETGFYEIHATAISSEQVKFLYFNENGNYVRNIDIILMPIDIPTDTLFILGNFNNFKFDNKYPLTKISETEFVIDISYPSDTLKYQIYYDNNAENYSRSFNGNQKNENYYLDKGCDYYSIFESKENVKRVKFLKSNSLNEYKIETHQIRFENDDLNNEFYKFQIEAIKADKVLLDYASSFKSNNPNSNSNNLKPKEIANILEERIDKYRKEYNSTKNIAVKKYISCNLMNYLSIVYLFDQMKIMGIKLFPVDYSADFIQETQREVPIISGFREYIKWDNGIIFITCLMLTNKSEEINKLFLDYINYSKNNNQKKLELEKAINYYKLDNYEEDLYRYYSGLYITNFPNESLTYSLKNELKRVKLKGKKIPNFIIKNLLEPKQTVSQNDLLGKYTLIDFWATTCGPCIKEIPNLLKAKELFPDLNILSISFDIDYERTLKFVNKNYTFSWLHCIEHEGFKSRLAKNLNVVSIPFLLLVNPDLTIVEVEGDLLGYKLIETVGKYLQKK